MKREGGFHTCRAHDGLQTIIPFWSDAAYARRAAKTRPGRVRRRLDSARDIPQGTAGGRVRRVPLPNVGRTACEVPREPRWRFDSRCRHPVEKLARRVEWFALLAAEENIAWTLVREDDPVHVDIRARHGASFVPLWSSGVQADRARRFVYAPDNDAGSCL